MVAKLVLVRGRTLCPAVMCLLVVTPRKRLRSRVLTRCQLSRTFTFRRDGATLIFATF